MTIKEEIVLASAKVGTPEFNTVTCTKGDVTLNCTELLNQLNGQVSDDVLEIATELTIDILSTSVCMPYAKLFTLLPPSFICFFSSSLFVSAFEAGRAFEQNRQDAAITELLERENKGD